MVTVASLLPVLVLMIYIYKKDNIDKEPWSLLIMIALFGAVSTVPTMFLELIFDSFLQNLLVEGSFLYIIIENFICVALVEEYWKRWAIKRMAWNSKQFNCSFDSIVYGVFSALGFAGLENLLYVSGGGLSVAQSRAVTAIPSHAIDGVIMGYYLGQAKMAQSRGERKAQKKYMAKSLIVPTIIHGIYDALLSFESSATMLIWFLFVVATDIWAMKFVNKASKEDAFI